MANEVKLIHATATAAYSVTNKYYPEVYRRQGGCFNGENLYQVFISKDESIARVVRKNVKTGDEVYSEPLPLHHGNDMTYNPNTNQVLVCHVSDMLVSIFDADTLEHIETRKMERGGSSITYSHERDEYLLGSGLFKCVRASDFTDAGELFSAHPDTLGLTTQGIASDKDHVYSLLCKGLGHSKYDCYVAVYDWQGNYESLITFKVEDGYEPENISIVDGEMYVLCCSPQPVATFYKVVLPAEEKT